MIELQYEKAQRDDDIHMLVQIQETGIKFT